MPMVTKLVRVLNYRQRLPSLKLHDSLITRSRGSLKKLYLNYLYFPLMATKLGRLPTSGRRFSKQTLKLSPTSCLNSTDVVEIEKVDSTNIIEIEKIDY